MIRARLAESLSREGFRVKEIATALKVTQPAVTQYLKRKRGNKVVHDISTLDTLIEPLSEKLVKRLRSGMGGVETAELLETARQVAVMSTGRRILLQRTPEDRLKQSETLDLLRHRLQLELTAAEKYLELANRSTDDYTKLLLRMIASDSIRHGDVVSQIISWLSAGSEPGVEVPGQELLGSILSLEDSAKEVSLSETVNVDHPVARLLLKWIDIDEGKHEMVVNEMVEAGSRGRGSAIGVPRRSG